MTEPQLLAMIEAAEKATPGPWQQGDDVNPEMVTAGVDVNGAHIYVADPWERDEDGAYIAACSPERIIALCRVALAVHTLLSVQSSEASAEAHKELRSAHAALFMEEG